MNATEYMAISDVSAATGIAAGTLRYWRHINEGPASFKMGRRVMYRRDDVEAWIAAQRAKSTRGELVL